MSIETYILEPWFVVTDEGDRLAITYRWSSNDHDGGHIKLSREDASRLMEAIEQWTQNR